MHYKELLDEVRRIILRYAKPERIYLYGSRANGEATDTSDVDIAFYDKECHDLFRIEDELAKLPTLLKVEVRNIAFTDERFRNRVEATGRVLYSAGKKQRFEDGITSFGNAFAKFSDAVLRKEEFYREGFGDIYLDLVVKRFEFTYEMSWKAIKRYLNFIGLECPNPRGCFKEAYVQKVIADEVIWLDMIEQRNLTSNVYDESEVVEILGKIEKYRLAFKGLLETLQARLREE